MKKAKIKVSNPSSFLFCIRVLPESPRWLIANNRLDEAYQVLIRYGGKDDQPIDEQKLRDVIQAIRRDQLATQEKEKTYTPLDLVRTPKMRRWTLIACYQWYVDISGIVVNVGLAVLRLTQGIHKILVSCNCF